MSHVDMDILRHELNRYQDLYKTAIVTQRVTPDWVPDMRERWYGASEAIECLIRRAAQIEDECP